MVVIGLTGGIASGKSFVAECFVKLGCMRINADEIGHLVLKKPDVIEAIVSRWGNSILDEAGQIDRRLLGQKVFQRETAAPGLTSDLQDQKQQTELEHLESITHPRIDKLLETQLEELRTQDSCSGIILDAPVMFKAGWDRVCDRIVFVHAELAIRQQRAASRGWPAGELQRRESFQLNLNLKRERSTDFIDNSHSSEQTMAQVSRLWQDWNLSDSDSLDGNSIPRE